MQKTKREEIRPKKNKMLRYRYRRRVLKFDFIINFGDDITLTTFIYGRADVL